MSPDPIAAVIGGGLAGAGAMRFAVGKIVIRRQLRDALRDAVPSARVAAIQTAGENGVGRNARMLLRVAEDEEDIWVRQVLAQTVVRHRWEPAVSQALIELRIWAKQELMWGQLASVYAAEEREAAESGAAGSGAAANGVLERAAIESGMTGTSAKTGKSETSESDDGPVHTLSAEATASLGWWDAS